jgi:hypothetical protein
MIPEPNRRPQVDGGASVRDAGGERRPEVTEKTISLEMSKADAEVMLGVLASERHNPEVEAVCDALRAQLDEKLAASPD